MRHSPRDNHMNRITAECSRCGRPMVLDVPAGSDLELAVKLSHLVVCAVCSNPRPANTPKSNRSRGTVTGDALMIDPMHNRSGHWRTRKSGTR